MNTDSRINNSLKNISFGIIMQAVQILCGFINRTVFIQSLSIEYLGAQGLFANILSLLSLTELGMGAALMYSLYKPIADRDYVKINALVNLYKKIFFTIGFIVAILGLSLMPFLDKLVNTDSSLIQNQLHLIFFLYLSYTVATYFFSHRISLLIADQRNYVVVQISSVVYIFQNILQIAVLILYKDFIIYLSVQLFCTILTNTCIAFKTNKLYPFLKEKAKPVDKETIKKLKTNVTSTAIIKFAGLLSNNTANIIINYFVGLAVVGLYSNYLLIISVFTAINTQIFNGLTGSIANINASESLEKKRNIFSLINSMNFIFYGIGALFIALFSNKIIEVWLGDKFTLSNVIPIMCAINFYILGMQNAVWTFKSTMGFFREGRFVVVGTAFINIALSFLLGHQFGLTGILLAPIIARVTTNLWYDPYIVFKKGLCLPFTVYVKRYLVFMLIGTATYILCYIFDIKLLNMYFSLILNIFVLCIVFGMFTFLLLRNSSEKKYIVDIILSRNFFSKKQK